jgi:hypothetical protein
MTVPSLEPFDVRAVRLSCASPTFERIADGLVWQVRRAMGVPDRAEPEVELEFAGLRQTLDAFYPEFTQIYANLLSSYLGNAASVALASLESEAVQAYLRVAGQIDADVHAALKDYAARIALALNATPAPG